MTAEVITIDNGQEWATMMTGQLVSLSRVTANDTF